MHRLHSLPCRWCAAALVGTLLLAAFSPAHASLSLNEQRSAYLEADRLLDQKKVNAWLKKKAELKQYPLYHYLIIKEVRATHSDYSNYQIAKIISRVDVPLPGSFKRWWLQRLKDRKDWDLIIVHYAGDARTETQCTVALAAMHSKSREDAMRFLEPLWLTGRSQPRQCDPLFESALKRGYIDDDLIWQRILLSAHKGQRKMVKYLRGLLDSEEIKVWVDRLDLTHRHPRDTIKPRLVTWSKSPYGRDVITHGLVRITRSDSDEGYEYWQALKASHPDTVSQLAATELRIAEILGWRRHHRAYQMLAGLPASLQSDSILQLKVRNSLTGENWTRVLDAIDRMSDEEKEQTEWRYWRARALAEAGNRREAKEILTSLAERRDFYGMLAADHLNLGYDLSPAGLTHTADDHRSLLDSEPAVARIREWLALRKPYSARRELTHLGIVRNGDSEFWSQAALLFDAWNWHDGAIRAIYASGRAADFQVSLSHPSPYLDSVRKESIRYGIPEHWILGIMRQESLFIHDIRSGAGAIGLMQLMPATARNVARRNKLKRPSSGDLHRASLNIRLGTSYFRRLLDQTDGNLVYSLAGYNAGPHRVKQWRETIRVQDPAVWVESIPFTETRNYVKKILVNFIIYENIHNVQHARIRDYLQMPNTQHALAIDD